MYEMLVEEGKVREFARATQSANEEFHGAHATIPPTFLTTAMLSWEPPEESVIEELGFDLGRVLHGEEAYTFHGPPPHAGTRLRVTTRIGKRFEKPGKRGGVMRFATVVHEFRNESGRLVADQHTTLIETAATPKAS